MTSRCAAPVTQHATRNTHYATRPPPRYHPAHARRDLRRFPLDDVRAGLAVAAGLYAPDRHGHDPRETAPPPEPDPAHAVGPAGVGRVLQGADRADDAVPD